MLDVVGVLPLNLPGCIRLGSLPNVDLTTLEEMLYIPGSVVGAGGE